MILGGDEVASRGETGQASAVLKQPRSGEHVDECGDINQWAIASAPYDPMDTLLGNARWRMSANCSQDFWKPAKTDRCEPVVHVWR